MFWKATWRDSAAAPGRASRLADRRRRRRRRGPEPRGAASAATITLARFLDPAVRVGVGETGESGERAIAGAVSMVKVVKL